MSNPDDAALAVALAVAVAVAVAVGTAESGDTDRAAVDVARVVAG